MINYSQMYVLPNAEKLADEIVIGYIISSNTREILIYSMLLLIIGFIFGLITMYLYKRLKK